METAVLIGILLLAAALGFYIMKQVDNFLEQNKAAKKSLRGKGDGHFGGNPSKPKTASPSCKQRRI